MGANRRIGGSPQLFEDVRHFFRGQRVVRLDRRMACGGRSNPLQSLLDAGSAIEAFQILRERTQGGVGVLAPEEGRNGRHPQRSEEHTSELQSPYDLVCRLL